MLLLEISGTQKWPLWLTDLKKKRKKRKISEPEKAGRQLDVAGNVSSDQKTAHFNENELTVLWVFKVKVTNEKNTKLKQKQHSKPHEKNSITTVLCWKC